MQHYFRHSQTVAVTPASPPTSTVRSSDVLIGSCILTFPLLLVLAILGYRHNRAKLRHKRIQYLEKLWALSPNETR